MEDKKFVYDSYQKIVDKIREMKPKKCSILGETGTGKTANVPRFLAKHGSIVFVVIPTKTGVRLAHNFIKNNMNIDVSEYIRENLGTAESSIIKYKNRIISKIRNFLNDRETEFIENESQIVWCTPGHIENLFKDFMDYLNRFKGKHVNLKFCEYMIVDEVHTDSKFIEMVINYWENLELAYPGISKPNLIKMSATYETNGLVFQYEPEVESEFGVSLNYLDAGGEEYVADVFKHEKPDFRGIIDEIPNIIMQAISVIPEGGTMLVFLPGKPEIVNVASKLVNYLEGMDMISEIIYAHSSLKDDGIKALESVKDNDCLWRFVLSTNICESSVTVPGVNVVISSMIEKRNVSGANEVLRLQTEFISKNSAKQQAGRTGRTCPGMIVRCCLESFYNKLPDKKQSELERLPITNEILKIMSVNIDVRSFFQKKSIFELNKSKKLLTDLCCLKKCGDFYSVTPMGKFVSNLPLACRNATFLANWIMLTEEIFSGIVLAVTIEFTENLFKRDFNQDLVSSYPLGTIYNVIVKYFEKYPGINIKHGNVIKFANAMKIDKDILKDILKKIFEIVRIVSNKVEVRIHLFDIISLQSFIIECSKKSYIKMYLDPKTNKYTNGDSKDEYSLSNKFLKNNDNYPYVIYGVILTTFGKNKNIELWVPEKNMFELPTSLETIDEEEDEDDSDEDDEEENSDEDEEEVDE